MKTKPKKPARRAKAEKSYTFNVTCKFSFQHMFSESEVMREPGGDTGDFEPTEKAHRELWDELAAFLESEYGAVKVHDVIADSDDLIGVI